MVQLLGKTKARRFMSISVPRPTYARLVPIGMVMMVVVTLALVFFAPATLVTAMMMVTMLADFANVSRRYALAIPVFFAPMVPARRRRIRLMPRPGFLSPAVPSLVLIELSSADRFSSPKTVAAAPLHLY